MLEKKILTAFFVLFFQTANSATYYFSSSSGVDSYTKQEAQNPNTPWKSIKKLNSIISSLQPGDCILFKGGDSFHGALVISKSGTLKSPIYFGKYDSGNNPVISGFREVIEWESKGGNLYESQISEINSNLNVLIINNEIYAMGRYPNDNENNKGYLTINSYKEGQITGSPLKTSLNFTDGEIVIRKNNWIIDRHLITSNSSQGISYLNFENKIAPMIGFGFFIQNHPLTLDRHGEWYFDKENNKILIYFIGDPSKGKIKLSTIPEIIKTQNKASNIYFENISFEGSNEDLISLLESSNITIESCKLEFIGKNGIKTVSSRNLTVSNTLIKNSLNGGVFLSWNDLGLVITNSTFEKIFNFPGMGQNGEMQGQGIYMSETSSDALLETNKFLNCGYNAINFSGNNITIKNNLIDTFCFIKDDGAGIYTFTGPKKTPFTNRKIIGNIILNGIGAVSGTKPYGITDLPYVEGIYLDTFINGVEIEGNTISNVKNKGIFLNNSKNIIVKNNKILNTGYSIYLKSDDINERSTNIIVKNNEFLASTETQFHFFIRTNFDDLYTIGEFDNNIFSRPLKNSQTIYFQTPKINGKIDLETWKNQYGFDKNSSSGPLKDIIIDPTEIKSSKMNNSVLFDYNFSNNPKSVSLHGTYIDLKGNKVFGSIEIPAYSTLILLKSRKSP